ncbi:MAG: hypothetical protein IKH68_04540 [Erysipelotrichaceae bacterium]|nr:hypothetical protein [Erysipelotrichaceae bacterium]
MAERMPIIFDVGHYAFRPHHQAGMVLSDQVSEFGQSSHQKACHPDEKVLKKFSQQMKALTAFHSNEGTTLRKETR